MSLGERLEKERNTRRIWLAWKGGKVGSEQRKIRRLLNHPLVLRVPLKPAPNLAVRRSCSAAW